MLQEAAEVVLKGGIIAYPTETIYGIGANAFDHDAIERIYEIKERDRSKPILIIIRQTRQLIGLIDHLPRIAGKLVDVFWPGPLTLIFKASPSLDPGLLGAGGSIGIRIPDNTICLRLLEACEVPLTSTSANISGAQNPCSIDQVYNNFGNKIDLYLDGGITSGTTPSTILDLTTDVPTIRRKGRISREKIEQVIGAIIDDT